MSYDPKEEKPDAPVEAVEESKLVKPAGKSHGVELGDLVFMKEVKKSSRQDAPAYKFPKGHAFGIYLGHVPLMMGEPSNDQLFRMMGMCGFISLDDIAQFIGDGNAKTCIDMFQEKYYGAEAEARAKAEAEKMPATPPQESRIVDKHGTPLAVVKKTEEVTQ